MVKDLEDPLEPGSSPRSIEPRGRLAGTSLIALGVVFGDIGTSPLYAIRECFHGTDALPVSEPRVLGVLSLVLWSLLLVISLKYLTYMLRASNRGEGGILALTSLLHPSKGEEDEGKEPTRGRAALIALGIFGAALLYADGAITPAISVLSAIEGLEVAARGLDPVVLPLSIAVLAALFIFQRRGTAVVGRIFGPVMLAWFLVIGALGLVELLRNPATLLAVDPTHAFALVHEQGWAAAGVLGAVFLVVTGGEALYADIGHFGVRPIRAAWFFLVLPALLLNYFGQGALLLRRPDAIENPFYALVPGWGLYPMVLLATAATIIASQAVISGAFSLTRQAIQLGYLPRLEIRHTSRDRSGQVFLPAVNWTLFAATVMLAWGFGRSSGLAGAYGVAVSTTMVVTTLLAAWVAVEQWHWRPWIAAAVTALLLVVDLTFLGANLTKIVSGGWIPLVVAGAIYVVMSTWKRGADRIRAHSAERGPSLEEFIDEIGVGAVERVPGTAVYLTGTPAGTPTALLHQVQHNRVVHERVIVLSVRTVRVPHVSSEHRIRVKQLEEGFIGVTVRYGFMETVDIAEALKALEDEIPSVAQASIFVSRGVVIPTEGISLSRWRARLFGFIARNAPRMSMVVNLPHERVIELGVEVEL